jgi:hypothetical protein
MIKKLMIFEINFLRRMFGPTKEKDGTWRIKTNEELDYLTKHNNIINQIRVQRLSWFGHVQRMSDNRMVKKIYKCKPITTILQGRPKSRREDNVKQDICKMKIKKTGQSASSTVVNGEMLRRLKLLVYEVVTPREEEPYRNVIND